MQIFTSDTPLAWGKLDIPLYGLHNDWFGMPMVEASGFTLVVDSKYLWFVSTFPLTTRVHPAATPGKFTPELWKYDVSELFLANPDTGEYLEFNLTSNGAWWGAKFSSVRVPSARQPDFEPHIQSYHDLTGDNYWVAGLKIPIIFLEKEIDFSLTTTANVTMIRDSPNHRYLSASKLPGAQPDFHQPAYFLTLSHTPLITD